MTEEIKWFWNHNHITGHKLVSNQRDQETYRRRRELINNYKKHFNE